ncbi:hypothetical protein KAU19_01510 [Candidatus Parcubacteria bacterium]|nr:hypothetical protein [Candidatus Parcubacteria bacterium]
MAKIIIGMVMSGLLALTGFRNLLLIAQKSGAGPIECQLSVLAPVLLGSLLYLFFAIKKRELTDLNMEYPKRRLL